MTSNPILAAIAAALQAEFSTWANMQIPDLAKLEIAYEEDYQPRS